MSPCTHAQTKTKTHTTGFPPGSLLRCFTARIARNLRVVLLIDPTHPQCINVLVQCPAIARRCEVVVLEGWRQDTMLALPSQQLSVSLPELCSRLPPTLPATLATIHVSGGVCFVVLFVWFCVCGFVCVVLYVWFCMCGFVFVVLCVFA